MQFLFKIYRHVLQAVRHKSSGADSRAQAFGQKLVNLKIARPEQIVGCTPGEIAALEKDYGEFPESYRAVLGVIGRGAGRLVVRDEFRIFADQLAANNEQGTESVRLWALDGILLDVPDDAIFIATRYGEHPVFIRSGRRADSPVWLIDDDEGTVTKVDENVWDYFDGFIEEGVRLTARSKVLR